MQFISNQDKQNHFSVITSALKKADEVWIATAFLKKSGLSKIISEIKELLIQGSSLYIIAGQHFALTEPAALYTLKDLFDKYPNGRLHIAHAIKRQEVFHPKLFLIRKGKEVKIISGSSNITEGGLINNIECSLQISVDKNDKVAVQVSSFFQTLFSEEFSEKATLLAIKRYESFYEKQKANQRKIKAIPDRRKSQQLFNYDNLKKHLKDYDSSDRKVIFEAKKRNYKEARTVLDEIADSPSLTKAEFSSLLDSLVGSKEDYSLWHSGSLFRLRRKVYPHYKKFQKLVKFIRDNKEKSPAFVFSKATQIVSTIEGAGINYITEIMMTYNPQKFANLNKNPITVLRKEGDVFIKSTSSSFSNADYEEYCDLVKEISEELGLKNMLEADSFFNNIYWKIYKKRVLG